MIKRKQRTSKSFARVYGSVERAAWVRGLPCWNCLRVGDEYTAIVNAHTETGGTSYKADSNTIVPLCSRPDGSGCHDKQHQHGWSVLTHLDTVDKRMDAARRIERAWLATHNEEE